VKNPEGAVRTAILEDRAMSDEWNTPIGSIGGIPGLGEPIPVLALDFVADLNRGNDSVLILVLGSSQSGVITLLMAIARNRQKLHYLPLVVANKTYWLRNVILQSVSYGGKVRLYFDFTPELDRLIAASKTGIYDRYGRASPWGRYGGG
jgi:hypothetical protein